MKIAVFTKNWLGDVIFEAPAVQAIKENFPDSHLIAIAPRRCREILKANPFVDEIVTFDERGEDRSVFAKWRLARKLKQMNIDKAFLFHRSSTRAWIARWAGIPERIGYDTKGRGSLLTHAVPETEGPIHDVQYFLNLLQAAGLRVSGDYAYEFYFQECDRLRAEHLIQQFHLKPNRLVAINPGANWEPKRWPPEYFRELAHRLIETYGVQIALTGSGEDELIAKLILNSGHHADIVSICGKTSLCELGAFFSMCRLVVSNDTGPLHIAAGVGTNVIGLFGPTAPLETAPLGRGKNVIIHYAPEGVKLPWIGKNFPRPWMELISPDLVLEAIKREQLL